MAQPTTDEIVRPHGDGLTIRLVDPDQRDEIVNSHHNTPSISIDSRVMADLRLFGVGALSPLTGFTGKEDYESILSDMRLRDGTVWPIPMSLQIGAVEAGQLRLADHVRLFYKERFVALVDIDHIYEPERAREAKTVYGTDDPQHPGVNALYAGGEFNVAGDVHVIDLTLDDEEPISNYILSPTETRRVFSERGWKKIVGFQTRNPMHRAHEYLQKCAMEVVDGLLMHPLIGPTKPGDIDVITRFACYGRLIDEYFPKERIVLSAFPASMRYAGPREAVFHALCRKNYGCTHFIVGWDHAGVGNYYQPYDAHRVFDQFSREEIGIELILFECAFYCRKCEGMATPATCPHDDDVRVSLSGTEVREMTARGKVPPPESIRPEVAYILTGGVGERSGKRRKRRSQRRRSR